MRGATLRYGYRARSPHPDIQSPATSACTDIRSSLSSSDKKCRTLRGHARPLGGSVQGTCRRVAGEEEKRKTVAKCCCNGLRRRLFLGFFCGLFRLPRDPFTIVESLGRGITLSHVRGLLYAVGLERRSNLSVERCPLSERF